MDITVNEMSEKQLNTDDTFSTGGMIRHIFLESLASSPTTVSSSSSTLLSPSNSNDVSIETCIKYLQSHACLTLPNGALDKFQTLMKKTAPNGRITWKMFNSISQRWIKSLDSQFQDGNNNLNEILNDDTSSNPDGSIIEEVSDDHTKSTELIKWSVERMDRTNNDTKTECDNSNVSINLHEQADTATEVELRMRIRRLDEDNSWLRDELERIEELAASYQRQFYTIRQRLDQIIEKCNQLERENEEQKEIILTMEQEEKRSLIAIEKAERDRKSYIKQLEIYKELIPNLNGKIDKLNSEKKNFIKQLTACRSKLKEKEVLCDILQEKNDQLTECNTNLEEYYEKTIRNLQERSDDLKNENVKLYSRMSSSHASSELNFTPSVNYLNSSLESLPDDRHKILPQNSLYEELKATGFSVEDNQESTKLQELKEQLDWYNEEIYNATIRLDELIQLLGRELTPCDKSRLSNASEHQSRHILILLDKITLLSDTVVEVFRKPSTNESGVQVSAEPLTNRQLNELNIIKFEDDLNTSIARKESASGDSFNIYFTIGSTFIKKDHDVEPLPKSIYTSTQKLYRRRWGREFNAIEVGTPSGDAPINGNLSPSPHSSTKLESKISLRSAMNINDNISRVSDAIAAYREKKIEENSDCESLSKDLLLSPIFCTPNMTEKNIPKRKISVFSRTYDIEKVFDMSHITNDRITSSTPAPGNDSAENSQLSLFSTAYRTKKDNSDASDSSSMSKLHSSIEEDTTNCEISVLNDQSVCIVPPKLKVGNENRMEGADSMCSIQQDSINSGMADNSTSITSQSDIEFSTNFHSSKNELKTYLTSLSIDNINNEVNRDFYAKNSTKSIDITRTSQSDINSMSQQLNKNCRECVASKECTDESTSVTIAMSSGEDSSDLSDSDAITNCNVSNGNKSDDDKNSAQNDSEKFGGIESDADCSAHTFSIPFEKNLPTSPAHLNKKALLNKMLNKREIVPPIKRSRSKSESLVCRSRERYCCACSTKKPKTNCDNQELPLMVFPSLPDVRMQKSGIANDDNDDLETRNMGEDELTRKFIAFSLGLCTDRLTLPRRRELSIRQRDQTERNLIREISKMQQHIQELAPLCFDSETIERIERTRNQVDIIARCAHKVSCTAETLGAIQQEYRISRAINLADRYLRILRNKCEKLVIDLAETKRILLENNIIIDDNTGECSEELTALRYRGLPTNNRTMTAKRRASIATIFRPIITSHDATKDGVRQRNSVSGRLTLRRPSFSAESQRWEIEKLNRTESSNSVGELREIFEHIESRRNSREENNNFMRLQVNICEGDESSSRSLDVHSHNGQEINIVSATDEESQRVSRRISRLIFGLENHSYSWRLILWCIIISFFIGFYVKDAISIGPCIGTPFKWWSIEEILERYIEVRNTAPRPI